MPLKRETFEYHDDQIHVRITVRQVSLAESMERDAMRAEIDLPKLEDASDEEGKTNFQTIITTRGHLMFTWPNCITGTVSIENLPEAVEELSLDELQRDKDAFFALPKTFIDLWEDFVVGLNPSYSPLWKGRRVKSKKPKETGSNSNSSTGT